MAATKLSRPIVMFTKIIVTTKVDNVLSYVYSYLLLQLYEYLVAHVMNIKALSTV